jgi:hypothetical protein
MSNIYEENKMENTSIDCQNEEEKILKELIILKKEIDEIILLIKKDMERRNGKNI